MLCPSNYILIFYPEIYINVRYTCRRKLQYIIYTEVYRWYKVKIFKKKNNSNHQMQVIHRHKKVTQLIRIINNKDIPIKNIL